MKNTEDFPIVKPVCRRPRHRRAKCPYPTHPTCSFPKRSCCRWPRFSICRRTGSRRVAAGLAALATLGVRNVFDLAMSSVFNTAAQIEDAADNPSNAMNRFGRPISDLLKPGIAGTVAIPDLRNASLDILADVADAAEIQAALGVITVRDLSVYQPFRAAREILNRVFFPEQLEAFDARVRQT